MKLVSEKGRSRVYRRDDGEYIEVRAQEQGFLFRLELATYESHDPADKAIIEKHYRALGADLSAFFAEHEEYEPIGEPDRTIGVGFKIRLPGWPGGVPGVALMVQQGYWPPAPEEEA